MLWAIYAAACEMLTTIFTVGGAAIVATAVVVTLCWILLTAADIFTKAVTGQPLGLCSLKIATLTRCIYEQTGAYADEVWVNVCVMARSVVTSIGNFVAWFCGPSRPRPNDTVAPVVAPIS